MHKECIFTTICFQQFFNVYLSFITNRESNRNQLHNLYIPYTKIIYSVTSIIFHLLLPSFSLLLYKSFYNLLIFPCIVIDYRIVICLMLILYHLFEWLLWFYVRLVIIIFPLIFCRNCKFSKILEIYNVE